MSSVDSTEQDRLEAKKKHFNNLLSQIALLEEDLKAPSNSTAKPDILTPKPTPDAAPVFQDVLSLPNGHATIQQPVSPKSPVSPSAAPAVTPKKKKRTKEQDEQEKQLELEKRKKIAAVTARLSGSPTSKTTPPSHHPVVKESPGKKPGSISRPAESTSSAPAASADHTTKSHTSHSEDVSSSSASHESSIASSSHVPAEASAPTDSSPSQKVDDEIQSEAQPQSQPQHQSQPQSQSQHQPQPQSQPQSSSKSQPPVKAQPKSQPTDSTSVNPKQVAQKPARSLSPNSSERAMTNNGTRLLSFLSESRKGKGKEKDRSKSSKSKAEGESNEAEEGTDEDDNNSEDIIIAGLPNGFTLSSLGENKEEEHDDNSSVYSDGFSYVHDVLRLEGELKSREHQLRGLIRETSRLERQLGSKEVRNIP